MKTTTLAHVSLLGFFASISPLALADPAVADEKAPKSEETEKLAEITEGSLTTGIRDSKNFSILYKALQATELDQVLGTKGTYTIFAPTDEAFMKLPEGALDKLMLPGNKEKLRSLLLFHVIPGNVYSADLKDGEVKTMNGEKVEIDVDGEDIEVEDSEVFSTDVVANNGIMHTIGEVMVPKGLDGFADLDEK